MIRFLLNIVAVLVTAYLLPGVIVDGFWAAFVLAIVLGILNITIRPLLILFTLPATIFTFGLFLMVINAVVVLIADSILTGFEVDGFWWAILFSLVLWITNSFLRDISSTNENKKGSRGSLNG